VEAELTACRWDDAGRISATHLRYHPAVPRDRRAGPQRSWGWSGETNLELATPTWARPERCAVNQTDTATPRAKSSGINGRHHCQLAALRSQDRWLLAEATTDSVDAVTTKVGDLAVPRDLMSVASDLRESAFMGGASQTDVACSRAF
jgi:hypothetical protein